MARAVPLTPAQETAQRKVTRLRSQRDGYKQATRGIGLSAVLQPSSPNRRRLASSPSASSKTAKGTLEREYAALQEAYAALAELHEREGKAWRRFKVCVS